MSILNKVILCHKKKYPEPSGGGGGDGGRRLQPQEGDWQHGWLGE